MSKENQPRWTSGKVKDGIQEIHIRRWNFFIDYIQEAYSPGCGWVHRGHRKDYYRLESTIDRKIADKSKTAQLRREQLDRFKMAIRGKRGANPPQYDEPLEWWALGQHFELLTPLLDWTHSPYTAAFFAFARTDGDDTRKRIVVSLNKSEVESRPNLARTVRFYTPNSDENARVIGQNGLFSFCESGEELESLIAQEFAGSTTAILKKIYLPNAERIAVLRGLEQMNINHLTLFPDLSGASNYANMQFELYSNQASPFRDEPMVQPRPELHAED